MTNRARAGAGIAGVAALIALVILLYPSRSDRPIVPPSFPHPSRSDRPIEPPSFPRPPTEALPAPASKPIDVRPSRTERSAEELPRAFREESLRDLVALVTDLQDRPLAGVTVRVLDIDGGRSLNRSTDAGGRAAFAGPPRKLLVTANKRSESRVEYAQGSEECDLGVVMPGEERVVAIRLRRLDGAIRVLVRDDRGEPVEGALLAVTANSTVEQTTDANGVATFRSLPTPGRAAVRLKEDSRSQTPSKHVIALGHEKSAFVDLIPDEVIEVRFEMERTGSLQVVVPDSGGSDVRGRLHLTRSNSHDRRNPQSKSVPVPGPGAYVLDGLPTGEYAVDFKADAASRLFIEEVSLVQVSAGEMASVTVKLARGIGSIAGRTIDDAGAPVAMFHISVQGADVDQAHVSKSVRTDEDGRFLVTGLPLGLYRVWVYTPGFKERNFAFFGAPDEAFVLVRCPEDDLVIELEPGCRIAGVVRDRTSADKVLSGVDVTIEPGLTGPAREDRTSAEGLFEFSNLRPGSYRLYLSDAPPATREVFTVEVGHGFGLESEARVVLLRGD